MEKKLKEEQARVLARLQEIRETVTDFTPEVTAEIEELEQYLAELSRQLDELRATSQETEKETKGETVENITAIKALSDAFTANRAGAKTGMIQVRAKASDVGAMKYPAGYSDATNILNGASASFKIEDVFNVVRTDKSMNFITWRFPDSADAVADGGLKPQIVGQPTPIDSVIKKVAGYITISDAMLDDDANLRAEVERLLANEIASAREREIIAGTGEGNHIRGLLATEGVGQITSDDVLAGLTEAVARILTRTDKQANAIIVSPDTWQKLAVATVGSAPVFAGNIANGGALTPWGIPVHISNAVPAGQAIVGDFNSATVYERTDVIIEAGYTDDNFIYDLLTVRAYQRLGLVVPNPDAFAVVKAS